MKRVIRLTESDIANIINEAMDELSNVVRLRRSMNSDNPNGLSNALLSSPDKYVPQNPRHQRGYDVLRDWVNYVCQRCGYDSDDVSKVLMHSPIRRFHNQNGARAIMDSYTNIFNYCVNNLKLRPGVVSDIADSIGEDLSYGMLNQN